jgi:hypothetical protein
VAVGRREERSRRREDAVAFAVFAGVAVAWLGPMLVGHRLGQSQVLWDVFPWAAERPRDLIGYQRSGQGDVALAVYPVLEEARAQIRDGHLPLWNPWIGGGMPLLGDMQSALAFPLTWLALLLGPQAAAAPIAAMKLLLAGGGSYMLARSVGAGMAGGVVAGLAFMLSAPIAVWLQHPQGSVFVLLPWLLYASDRLVREPTGGRAVGAAAAIGLTILAGHPETALYALTASLAYGLAVAVATRRLGWRLAGWWIAAHVVGVAAAGVALVPFLEAMGDSVSVAAHAAEFPTLPLSAGIAMLAPNIFGDGQPDYFGPLRVYQAVALYTSLPAVGLAVAGLLRHRRDPRIVALAAIGGVAALAAFGLPPVAWALQSMPLFSLTVQGRLFFVLSLAIAVAAGVGLDSVQRRPARVRTVVVATGAVASTAAAMVLVLRSGALAQVPHATVVSAAIRAGLVLALTALIVSLVGRGPRRVVMAGVLTLLVLDVSYLQSFNVMLPAERAYPHATEGIRTLSGFDGSFRLGLVRDQSLPVYPPNTPSLAGVATVAGRDHPPPRRWWRFQEAVLDFDGPRSDILTFFPRPDAAALTGHRMLNTRYWATAPGTPSPAAGMVAVYRGADLDIYRDPQALPAAWIVRRTRAVDADVALEALARGEVDPRAEALVEGAATLRGTGPELDAPLTTASPRELRVSIPALDSDAWLVVAAGFARGWRAEVDRVETLVHPTNYALIGVHLPAGANEVVLRRGSHSFWVGLGLTAVALALMAGVLARSRFLGRR